MESDRAAPESSAFRQLELLVHNLGEELAVFRRRAQAAEVRVKTLEGSIAAHGGGHGTVERVEALEHENAELRARLAFATERTTQLLTRIRFLRQQNGRPSAPGSKSATGAHP